MSYKWKGNSFPFINQARSVVGRPELSPDQLSDHSNLKVEWECLCGQIFIRKMHRATVAGIRCSSCSRTGTSRLEFEVAALLRTYFPDFTIQQNYTHPDYYKKVDLYLTEIDMVIELDPYHSHYKRYDSDLSITEKLNSYFTHVLRIRDEKLPSIHSSLAISTKLIMDAREWVKTILSCPLLPMHQILTEKEVEEALKEGNNNWDKNKLKKLPNSASEFPEVDLHFIRNISRPGRKTQYLPVGSGDICEWKCFTCDSTYKLAINRFVKGTRCPKELGEKFRNISMSNPKFPKLIDTHPIIFHQLVKNVEYPDFDVSLTNKNLRQDCLWKCEVCGNEWISKPYVRIKQSALGCRKCTWGKYTNTSQPETKKE